MSKAAKNKGDEKGRSVFDRMIMTLMDEQEVSGFLDDCMSFDTNRIGNVPLRYRLIALGFVKHSTLSEVNESLKNNGCAVLYSRSLWEASLIYAFHNGMSYNEWKKLQDTCRELRESDELKDKYFRGSRITIGDIREYVEANSDLVGNAEVTRHITKTMDEKIKKLAQGEMDFREFLKYSFDSMSPVREKTRYYFCKYLNYYLESCIERYLETRDEGAAADSEAEELAIFKGLTELKRKKMSDEEVRDLLHEKAISPGAIFDAFNYFFFDYVSLDWMDVLLEYYGDISSVPESDRKKVADALRKYEPAKYSGMSDEEVLAARQEEMEMKEEELDRAYSEDDPSKGYQRNRAGENTIRRYIKGGLDIDRTTLICFLLFFGNKSDLPKEHKITRDRLDEILMECGFSELRREDEFDDFVIRYMESDEPVDLLMEEVTYYALEEENSFLFKTYLASRSAEEDMGKLMKESR